MSSPITNQSSKHSKEKKKKRKGHGGGLPLNSDSFDAEDAGVASNGIIIVDTADDNSQTFADQKYRREEPSPDAKVLCLDVKPVVEFNFIC